MKYEYKTTTALDKLINNSDNIDPKQPDGDGWEMCGMAAMIDYGSFMPRTILYWSWRRTLKKTATKK